MGGEKGRDGVGKGFVVREEIVGVEGVYAILKRKWGSATTRYLEWNAGQTYDAAGHAAFYNTRSARLRNERGGQRTIRFGRTRFRRNYNPGYRHLRPSLHWNLHHFRVQRLHHRQNCCFPPPYRSSFRFPLRPIILRGRRDILDTAAHWSGRSGKICVRRRRTVPVLCSQVTIDRRCGGEYAQMSEAGYEWAPWYAEGHGLHANGGVCLLHMRYLEVDLEVDHRHPHRSTEVEFQISAGRRAFNPVLPGPFAGPSADSYLLYRVPDSRLNATSSSQQLQRSLVVYRRTPFHPVPHWSSVAFASCIYWPSRIAIQPRETRRHVAEVVSPSLKGSVNNANLQDKDTHGVSSNAVSLADGSNLSDADGEQVLETSEISRYPQSHGAWGPLQRSSAVLLAASWRMLIRR